MCDLYVGGGGVRREGVSLASHAALILAPPPHTMIACSSHTCSPCLSIHWVCVITIDHLIIALTASHLHLRVHSQHDDGGWCALFIRAWVRTTCANVCEMHFSVLLCGGYRLYWPPPALFLTMYSYVLRKSIIGVHYVLLCTR